jgi:DNA invertase Pin-like site-specific DNA recombinase
LRAFCEQQGWEVIEVFTEEASGAKDDREVLANAVAFASAMNSKLVVLRVDRLGRKLSTVARLLEDEGLQICVAELGECLDPFVLGIYALLAQKERELISKRTKEALAVLKAKGVKLGNPNLSRAQAKGVATMKKKADELAARYGAMINNLRLMGKSYRECGELLNLRTKKGNLMCDKGVSNIHKRWLSSKEQ